MSPYARGLKAPRPVDTPREVTLIGGPADGEVYTVAQGGAALVVAVPRLSKWADRVVGPTHGQFTYGLHGHAGKWFGLPVGWAIAKYGAAHIAPDDEVILERALERIEAQLCEAIADAGHRRLDEIQTDTSPWLCGFDSDHLTIRAWCYTAGPRPAAQEPERTPPQ